jgi:hypothetical protein
MRNIIAHGQPRYVGSDQPLSERRPSREARLAMSLAVFVLPRADKARYRAEFASELADLSALSRTRQWLHAFRLATHAVSLRGSLTNRSGLGPSLGIAVGFTFSSASLTGIGWPGAVLCGAVLFVIGWTISNQERTKRLATLIRAARGKK